MNRFLRGGAYMLVFLLMAIAVPYFFKQMPFIILPLLLILAILLIRKDMIEALRAGDTERSG